MAALTAAALSSARLVMEAYVFSYRFVCGAPGAAGASGMALMLRRTLLSATTSLLVVASPCGPAVDMLYSLTTLPTSHVLIPESEIDIDTEPTVLREFIRSAMRPPQPVR